MANQTGRKSLTFVPDVAKTPWRAKTTNSVAESSIRNMFKMEQEDEEFRNLYIRTQTGYMAGPDGSLSNLR